MRVEPNARPDVQLLLLLLLLLLPPPLLLLSLLLFLLVLALLLLVVLLITASPSTCFITICVYIPKLPRSDATSLVVCKPALSSVKTASY